MSKLKNLKPISCRWIYKIKRRVDGLRERHKDHLIAQGFTQEYDLDYDKF